MQISNFTPFVRSTLTYATNSFKDSSWKGRTVQIVGGLFCLSVIFYLFSRKKPQEPSHEKPIVPIRPAAKPAPKPAVLPQREEAKPLPSVPVVIVQSPPVAAPLPVVNRYEDKPFYQAVQTSIVYLSDLSDINSQTSQWNDGWDRLVPAVLGWLRQSNFEEIYEHRMRCYPDLQPADLMQEYQALPSKRRDEKAYCLAFKSWIAKLREFDLNWKKALLQGLQQELDKIPSVEFKSLPDYLTYLNPDPKNDESCFGMKRRDFQGVGLVSMEDIEVLQLRIFAPHFEALEQLTACLNFMQSKVLDASDIQEQLEQAKAACVKDIQKVLQSNLSALEGVEPALKSFKAQLETAPDLQSLRREDFDRQKRFLKEYVSQTYHQRAWTRLFQQGIYTLKACQEKHQNQDPYRLGITIG